MEKRRGINNIITLYLKNTIKTMKTKKYNEKFPLMPSLSLL